MRPLAATSTAMRGVADWPAIWRSAYSGPGRLCVIPDPGLARYFLRVGCRPLRWRSNTFADLSATICVLIGLCTGMLSGLRTDYDYSADRWARAARTGADLQIVRGFEAAINSSVLIRLDPF